MYNSINTLGNAGFVDYLASSQVLHTCTQKPSVYVWFLSHSVLQCFSPCLLLSALNVPHRLAPAADALSGMVDTNLLLLLPRPPRAASPDFLTNVMVKLTRCGAAFDQGRGWDGGGSK
jgi:hypothetical protein